MSKKNKEALQKELLKIIFTGFMSALLNSKSKNGGNKASTKGAPLMSNLSEKEKEDLLSIISFFDSIINAKGFKKYKIHIDESNEDIIIRAFVRHKKK